MCKDVWANSPRTKIEANIFYNFKQLCDMRIKQAVKRYNRIILFLSALSLSTSFSACGKRKPPLPPFERVSQRVEISGFQRGNQVRLSWTMPNRNAPNGSILNIARADVYRLAENINSPENLTEEEFANRSTLITSLSITAGDFTKKTLSYFDTRADCENCQFPDTFAR
jgi:hypothetical protein